MIIDSHIHMILPVEQQLALMKNAGVERTILFSTRVHPEQATDLESFEQEMSTLFAIIGGQRNSGLEAARGAIQEQIPVTNNKG